MTPIKKACHVIMFAKKNFLRFPYKSTGRTQNVSQSSWLAPFEGISCSIVCKEELRFQYCISWPPHYSGDLFILCLSTEQVSFKKGTEQGRNLKA